MAKTTAQANASARKRRADAERSITAITNAALDALASDPDVSMAAIARRAGVVRATIYMHFPTRESLLDAVMEEATGRVAEAIRNAEPNRGEPKEALERVILATWKQLSEFHNILQINMRRLSAKELRRRHLPMTTQFIPLLQRGIEGPLLMLNLLRFREIADYSDFPDLAPTEPISGSAAYDRYVRHTLPFLAASGGSVEFYGTGGHTFVGPPDERWDRVMLI